MKKFQVYSLILLSLLFSCSKGKVESTTQTDADSAKVEVQKADVIKIDSVSVNDSVKVNKNLTVASKSKVLVFSGIENKAILDSIYGAADIHLVEYSKEKLIAELNKKNKDYFDQNKKDAADLERDFPQTWYANSDMKVFSNENDFLTIKYTGDGFSGGAHGYYYENYKVFDLRENKTLQLSDILLTPDSSVWKRALMDNFLKNDEGKGQKEMLLVKEISPNKNFYFDKENLYFLYNQYEITAYAAGPVLIKVPLSEIKLMLKPEFIKRIGL